MVKLLIFRPAPLGLILLLHTLKIFARLFCDNFRITGVIILFLHILFHMVVVCSVFVRFLGIPETPRDIGITPIFR
jgi:hypothetical protein